MRRMDNDINVNYAEMFYRLIQGSNVAKNIFSQNIETIDALNWLKLTQEANVSDYFGKINVIVYIT